MTEAVESCPEGQYPHTVLNICKGKYFFSENNCLQFNIDCPEGCPKCATESCDADDDKGANVGAILGGVLGGAALILVISLIAYKKGAFASLQK